MPTTADWVQETRGYVYGSDRPAQNALNADIDPDVTTVTLTYPQNVGGGSTLSIDLEVMYVWSYNVAANSAVVQRGYGGSPQGPHTAGALVTVNPRFTDWEILKHLNNDLLDLSGPTNGLYQITTESIVAVSAREGYDFPTTGFQSIADIRWQVPNSETQEWRPITDYRVVENMPTTVFPSGTVLFINGYLPTPQQPIQIRYKADLGQLQNLSDDVVSTTGIPASAVDLPPMGAALRIMAGRPIGRAQYTTQGDTRRASEVSVNDVVQAPAALRQVRASRLATESAKLAQIWPFILRSRDVMWPSQVN